MKSFTTTVVLFLSLGLITPLGSAASKDRADSPASHTDKLPNQGRVIDRDGTISVTGGSDIDFGLLSPSETDFIVEDTSFCIYSPNRAGYVLEITSSTGGFFMAPSSGEPSPIPFNVYWRNTSFKSTMMRKIKYGQQHFFAFGTSKEKECPRGNNSFLRVDLPKKLPTNLIDGSYSSTLDILVTVTVV